MVDRSEIDELLAILISDGDDEARERAALALGPFGVVAVDRLAAVVAAGDADARWWAARTLAETGEDKAVPLLVGVLSDADPDVRACAALGLGRMGAVSAAPALVERLADVSGFVSSIAADAVCMMGEPAVPALVEMLAAGSPQARVLVVRALARIQSPEGIGALLEVAEDSNYLVRYYAQEALEALGVGMVYFAP
jgi:HEAT repeat protein